MSSPPAMNFPRRSRPNAWQRMVGFLRSRAARRWIPLPASILVHAVVIGGLVYSYQQEQASTPAEQRRANVADALLVQGARIGTPRQMNMPQTRMEAPARTLIAPPVVPETNTANSQPVMLPSPESKEATGGGATPLIGLPMPSEQGGTVGVNVPEASQPQASFMGISGDALRVVFVCDASGSMMDRLPRLQEQLRFSIEHLAPVQWFNVIFFQNSRAIAADAHQLIQALPGNVERIEKLLPTISARGSSNPLTAIRLAFAQRPQVVYLLTDGDFEDVAGGITDRQITDAISRLNTHGAVRVNTILFISDMRDLQQEDARGGRAVLQKIARENDGTFKIMVAE